MPVLPIDGVEHYYELHGSGDPVVLIHGLGSSARDWEYQRDAFAASYRVLVYDVRGHGRSAKPPGPYGVPLFARDLSALLRALDIPRAHLVGISMGGMIALQLAADSPGQVRSLVVTNTGPDLVPRTTREHFQVWQRKTIQRLLGMRRLGQVLGGRMFPKDEQADLRRMFVEHWAANDPRAYRDTFNGLVGWSVIHRLGAIACPVLVIAADQDYTALSVKQDMVARLPNARLAVVADSRHATPVEHPDEFNRLVLEFLRTQGKGMGSDA